MYKKDKCLIFFTEIEINLENKSYILLSICMSKVLVLEKDLLDSLFTDDI